MNLFLLGEQSQSDALGAKRPICHMQVKEAQINIYLFARVRNLWLLQKARTLQSNFNGSNIFWDHGNLLWHVQFELMRVVPGQEVNEDNLGMYFRSSIK